MLKKMKGVERELLIISIIIISLLVLSVSADSYIIGSSYNSIINDSIKSGTSKTNILSDFVNLIVGFLTIKQIGFVSASANTYCCEKTLSQYGGNWCVSGVPSSECDPNYQSTSASCATQTSFCGGTCIDTTNSLCATGTSKSQCESSGGTYVTSSTSLNQIPQCSQGCCSLNGGSQKKTTSSVYCTSLGGSFQAFNGNFQQQNCTVSTNELGACVFSGNKCILTTQTNCNGQIKGHFYSGGILCTNPSINTTCIPTSQTECSPYGDGNVYFVDSCGNIANIYDLSKIVNPSNPYDPNWGYWGKIVSPSCSNNPQSCGLCDSFSSTCQKVLAGDNKPSSGNYMCKSTTCNVTNNPYFPSSQLNGRTYAYPWESWCIYEGYVGPSNTDYSAPADAVTLSKLGNIGGAIFNGGHPFILGNYSSDSVGSVYGLEYCNPDGTIVPEMSDANGGRGFVCGEGILKAPQANMSIANSRINAGALGQCEAIQLKSYFDGSGNTLNNPDKIYQDNLNTCSANTDCRLQSVNVDQYFRFDVCVPKYPPSSVVSKIGNSLELQQAQGTQNVGDALSSINCTVTWVHNLDGWDCAANCNCLNQDFANQMNDLCISVGDFGGYVNVAGNYTKNFETFNINDLDSSKYNYGNQGNNYSSNGDIGPWKIQEYLKGFSEINSPTNTPQFNFPVVGDSNNNLQDPANINLANIKDISGIISAVSGAVGAVAGVGLTVVAAIGGTGALLGPVGIPLLIIAALAAIVLAVEQIFGFGQTKTIPVSFQCEAWQPPKGGGADCSLCNQGPLPCTQYMCYSLGQACQYSENLYYSQQNPQCISMVDDHAAPVISFANISGNYLVTNITQNNLVIGVNISEPDGSCIPAYTSLNITLVTTNATGQLKYSECAYNWSLQSPPPSSDNGWTLNEKNPFSEKSFLSFNHTLVNLQMPPVSSLPSVDISSGYPGQRTGEVNLYMRCEDAFSPPNSNPVPYIINFCEKEAPDTQIAQISSSSPTNASYLAYKIYNANLIMQISKPAYCSFNYGQDEPYSSMAPMTCTYNPDYVGLGGTCNATLTGLNALQNNIYIKCEDQPWLAGINESQRNINNVGFLYTLYDSQSPLNISSMSVQSGTSPVSLNGNIPTLKSGTSPVSIQLSATTSGGADGSAICNYQLIGVGGADTFFSDINGLTTKHTQPFNLVGGAYNVQINCTDSAGNSAIANGLFNVQIDNIPPSVTRVYKSGDNLVINTDKIAMCYYSTIGCSYDIKGQNSVQMDSLFTTSHSTNWNSGLTYYVRCIDVYGNINNGCAIVVSPGT